MQASSPDCCRERDTVNILIPATAAFTWNGRAARLPASFSPEHHANHGHGVPGAWDAVQAFLMEQDRDAEAGVLFIPFLDGIDRFNRLALIAERLFQRARRPLKIVRAGELADAAGMERAGPGRIETASFIKDLGLARRDRGDLGDLLFRCQAREQVCRPLDQWDAQDQDGATLRRTWAQR